MRQFFGSKPISRLTTLPLASLSDTAYPEKLQELLCLVEIHPLEHSHSLAIFTVHGTHAEKMKTIALISCVKQKQNKGCKAEDLYISPFFIKNLAYAKSLCPDKIFILSAKHGLLPLAREIDTYDLTLNNFRTKELKEWSEKTLSQLRLQADLDIDIFIFLAGERYRKYLLPKIKYHEIPLKGLRIGKQLQFLTTKSDEKTLQQAT